jgi:hypothetical protein
MEIAMEEPSTSGMRCNEVVFASASLPLEAFLEFTLQHAEVESSNQGEST